MQEKKYNDAKKEIRSVLLTYQNGVSLDEFLRDYRSLVGEKLPSRCLGFTSDIQFLRSMPDVVHISTNDIGKICLTGIADKASQHIQKLVSKQRKQKPNNKSRKNTLRQPSRPTISYKSQTFVPGPVRAEMIQVAAMYPDGIALPSFVLAYYKKYNKYLTLEKGLLTLESMISVISDLEIKSVRNEKKVFCKIQNGSMCKEACKIDKNHASAQLLERGKSQLLTSNSLCVVDSSGVPEAIQKNFIKVLEKCPEGIPAVHFPPLYENVTRQSFDMLELGYNSLLELVDALPKIFKRVLNPNDAKCWIILPANAYVKSYPTEEGTANHKKSPPVKQREGIPDDAAHPLLQFETPVMPINVNLDEYLPVFVSAIVNPWLFWFQLQLNEEIKEFEKLEHDMGCFYGSYSSYKYKMHDADICVGATCIVQCQEDKQWYRALIKAIPTRELVNVLFVDYGSRDNVSRETLRYVRSKYMDYPAHAFRAELAGVKPVGDNSNWDSKSSERFIELCTSASIMAQLIPIDDDAFSVYLCDTSEDVDIHINDTLVKDGFADLCFEDQNSKNESSNEPANSYVSSGVNNDPDNYVTTNSSDIASQTFDASSDSSTDYKEPIPLEPRKKLYTSDSNSLPVNRKLDFLVEKECNDMEPEACTVINEFCSRRYIKRVKDYSFVFHVVNHENNPFVSAGDVSRLLWKDGNSSYLTQRLLDREIVVPTVMLSKEDCPELFKQLKWYNVVDMKSNDSSVNLYTLENVLKVLNIFGHPSISVKRVIEGEMREFNAHHPIWHGFSYDNWEDVERDIEKENLDSLCLAGLKTKLQALKMKRLKLLNINSANYVSEIKRNEHLQYVIQKRMEYIEDLWSED